MHFKIIKSLILLHLIKMCFGEGTISIRLTKYSNKDGKGYNGNCCETPISFACLIHCDHFFILCLDRLGGSPTGVEYCPMGKKTTGSIGQNEIIFNNVIGGTPNPVKFPFEKWLGGFLIKVEVWDRDPNEDDFVDFFSVNVTFDASTDRSRAKRFEAKERTLLEFQVKVVCDENWCGPRCDQNCTGFSDDPHDDNTIPGMYDNKTTPRTDDTYEDKTTQGTVMVPFGTDHASENEPNTTLICNEESCPDSDSHTGQASNGSKVAAIVSVLIIICITIVLIIIWRIHLKKPKQPQASPNNDFTHNGDIYHEAQPYQSHAAPTVNAYDTNYTDAGTENDTYMYDNPVYERSSTYISERSYATSNIDLSTGAQASIKMDANIETVQYCNVVVVKDTGDIYAEPNK